MIYIVYSEADHVNVSDTEDFKSAAVEYLETYYYTKEDELDKMSSKHLEMYVDEIDIDLRIKQMLLVDSFMPDYPVILKGFTNQDEANIYAIHLKLKG